MDEDKDSKQNLDLYSPTRCVDSLELTNATTPLIAGDMPPLTNLDMFNPPIKSMASGFNSFHAGIFSMLFVIF